MAKLKLDFPIINEVGEVVDEKNTAGQILAGFLLRAVTKEEGPILKFHKWAMALGSNQAIELDAADKKLLTEQILRDEGLFNITKAPILAKINELKKD